MVLIFEIWIGVALALITAKAINNKTIPFKKIFKVMALIVAVLIVIGFCISILVWLNNVAGGFIAKLLMGFVGLLVPLAAYVFYCFLMNHWTMFRQMINGEAYWNDGFFMLIRAVFYYGTKLVFLVLWIFPVMLFISGK
jgi:hypothetical protein